MALFGTRVGRFEDVNIYEWSYLGKGFNSGGLALPGYGIIVGKNVFTNCEDLHTVRHEYGHILQARQTGWIRFYLFVGLPSLFSAWTNWHGRRHQLYWTETWCNFMARDYFKDVNWPEDRFPCCDLSDRSKFWLIE